jgi:Protein of unknown function (DUF3804)
MAKPLEERRTRQEGRSCGPPRLPRRHVEEEDVAPDCGMGESTRTAVTTASSSSSSSRRLLRPDLVTALLHDLYDDLNSNVDSKSRECWKALYQKYHAPDYLMVRPSGNPIHSSGFIDLFCCEDIRLFKFELVSVQQVRILAHGLVAVVVYTVDQFFSYKGVLQNDRAVLSCVLEEIEGDIKITQEHRSSGKPILPLDHDQEDRWDETNSSSAPTEVEGKQSVF